MQITKWSTKTVGKLNNLCFVPWNGLTFIINPIHIKHFQLKYFSVDIHILEGNERIYYQRDRIARG